MLHTVKGLAAKSMELQHSKHHARISDDHARNILEIRYVAKLTRVLTHVIAAEGIYKPLIFPLLAERIEGPSIPSGGA